MITQLKEYRNLINQRLDENWKSFKVLFDINHFGNCISIMCQELDQFIIVLFLIKQKRYLRDHFMKLSIENQKWYIVNKDNKKEYVTEDLLLGFIKTLTGWEKSIYEFGFIFKHLTNNANYALKDPIQSLGDDERQVIYNYIKEYHKIDFPNGYTMLELIPILPMIFEKISDNLKNYLLQL